MATTCHGALPNAFPDRGIRENLGWDGVLKESAVFLQLSLDLSWTPSVTILRLCPLPLSQPWVTEDRRSGLVGGGFGQIHIADGGSECSHKLKINT